MSTRSRWSHLDPLTRDDLTRNRTADGSARFDCGCRRTSEGVVWLCDYHEGFEDGAEAARNDMEREADR